ncbi:hypothetical protein FPV67DRAFT_1461987 [Lyophyllum atratum]|nr:hypothetical protein FPV67DRAFT_1461987 [Lyophyllum atratum]
MYILLPAAPLPSASPRDVCVQNFLPADPMVSLNGSSSFPHLRVLADVPTPPHDLRKHEEEGPDETWHLISIFGERSKTSVVLERRSFILVPPSTLPPSFTPYSPASAPDQRSPTYEDNGSRYNHPVAPHHPIPPHRRQNHTKMDKKVSTIDPNHHYADMQEIAMRPKNELYGSTEGTSTGEVSEAAVIDFGTEQHDMLATSGSDQPQRSDRNDEYNGQPRVHTLTTVGEKNTKKKKSNKRMKPSSDSAESDYYMPVYSPEMAASSVRTTATDPRRILLMKQLAQVEANLAADEEKLTNLQNEQKKMDTSRALMFTELRARREEKHEEWEILRRTKKLGKKAFRNSKPYKVFHQLDSMIGRMIEIGSQIGNSVGSLNPDADKHPNADKHHNGEKDPIIPTATFWRCCYERPNEISLVHRSLTLVLGFILFLRYHVDLICYPDVGRPGPTEPGKVGLVGIYSYLKKPRHQCRSDEQRQVTAIVYGGRKWTNSQTCAFAILLSAALQPIVLQHSSGHPTPHHNTAPTEMKREGKIEMKGKRKRAEKEQKTERKLRENDFSLQRNRPDMITETLRCPPHKGVPGNEKSDEWPRLAAEEPTAEILAAGGGEKNSKRT